MFESMANVEVGVHNHPSFLDGLTPGFPLATGVGYKDEIPCVSDTVCTVSLPLCGDPFRSDT